MSRIPRCSVPLLLSLVLTHMCSIAHAQTARTFVAAGQVDIAYVVTATGDAFASSLPGNSGAPQPPWTMIGNIFTAAGSGSNAGIVGVGGIRDGLQIALASNGDYYYVSFDLRGLGAILEGNVFQEGGHVTSGDEMNALGPTGANYLYAVARNGDMFRKSVTGSCPCGWIYAGNVPGGATPSHVRSWGSIKSAYR